MAATLKDIIRMAEANARRNARDHLPPRVRKPNTKLSKEFMDRYRQPDDETASVSQSHKKPNENGA